MRTPSSSSRISSLDSRISAASKSVTLGNATWQPRGSKVVDSVEDSRAVGRSTLFRVEEDEWQPVDWAAVVFTPANFNGIVIADMDFSGLPGSIVGLDIATDAPGWNDAFASFTSDSVALNYASLGAVLSGFSMTVDLVVQRDAPEPTMLGLLVLGLAALRLAARRRFPE